MKNTKPVYCSSCDTDTNQSILFSKKTKSRYSDYKEDFCVIECKGCSTVSFLQILHVPGMDPFYSVYPDSESFESYSFLPDEDTDELPKVIRELYSEVEEAFSSDSAILAGIGLRTIVESICLNQGIAGTNLQQKIKGLHQQGLISKSEEPILDKLRLIGNSSAHEIKKLSMDKLEYALGIVNHVLRSIYVLPKLNKKLKI